MTAVRGEVLVCVFPLQELQKVGCTSFAALDQLFRAKGANKTLLTGLPHVSLRVKPGIAVWLPVTQIPVATTLAPEPNEEEEKEEANKEDEVFKGKGTMLIFPFLMTIFFSRGPSEFENRHQGIRRETRCEAW